MDSYIASNSWYELSVKKNKNQDTAHYLVAKPRSCKANNVNFGRLKIDVG